MGWPQGDSSGNKQKKEFSGDVVFFSFINYSWVTSATGEARTSPTRPLQKSSESVESFCGCQRIF